MGYTAVPPVVAGNIYTPTMYNTFLADNLNTGVMRKLNDSLDLAAPAASIDFTSIPATLAGLLLVVNGRTSDAVVLGGLDIRFNNDSAANYNKHELTIQNATVSGGNTLLATAMRCGILPGASSPAGRFGGCFVFIPNYTSGTPHKVIMGLTHASGDDTAANQQSAAEFGTWKNVAAINRITVYPNSGANLAIGSRATLYGLPL